MSDFDDNLYPPGISKSDGSIVEGDDIALRSSPFWIQVALSPNKTAFTAAESIGHFDSPVNGNITAFVVRCDPAQKPSAIAAEFDLNKADSSTGARTSVLSAVATVATGTREGTGTVLTNGTESISLGQRIVIDGDQGSDGMDYIASIQITPTS